LIIILMGVSGAGKTTIGQWLAEEVGWLFYDGDGFHPQANVAKMSQGIPLTDEDRHAWLATLRQLITGLRAKGESAIIACSALKQSYRDYLSSAHDRLFIVYLKGNYDLIQSRLQERQDHFMKAGLLASQFEALEEPENALVVDVAAEPAEIVRAIRQALAL
jgi:gluconokinase